MTTERNVLGRPLPVVPDDWVGTKPEYYIYRAILRRGLRLGIDFSYEPSFFGVAQTRASIQPDFLIFSPRVGIQVQGERFHFPPFGSPTGADRMNRIALEAAGVRVEFISGEESKVRPDAAVDEAIRGTRGRGPLEVFRSA